jgi:actin related protein 2/3 complex subunit 5
MSFRIIDVDAYDEDVLTEDELYDPDPRDPAQILDDTKQQQAAVRSSLNKYVPTVPDRPFNHAIEYRGDITGSLNMALDSPPYGPGIEEAKVCSPHECDVREARVLTFCDPSRTSRYKRSSRC